MKRKGNLWSSIIDKNNIQQAIYNASKGKRNRATVKKILNNIVHYTNEIQKILISGYVASEYAKKKIFDGARQKERIIYRPKFYPDQIIHWCLMQIVEPIFIRGNYIFSCASIRGRGQIYAVKYIQKILKNDRKHTKYNLKLDINKFYPSIDKSILKYKFRRIIKDRDTLILLDTIVDSYEEPTGVPIGNYTSQFFANYYLQELDHFIKEKLKVPYYIRYMDDILIFGNNKKKIHCAKKEIENFINKEKLTLKKNWRVSKTDTEPIDFIGKRFYRDYITIRDTTFLRLKRRIKKISKKSSINYTDATAVISYHGMLKHTDSYKVRQKYLYPFVDIDKCKEVIQNESRKRYKTK